MSVVVARRLLSVLIICYISFAYCCLYFCVLPSFIISNHFDSKVEEMLDSDKCLPLFARNSFFSYNSRVFLEIVGKDILLSYFVDFAFDCVVDLKLTV